VNTALLWYASIMTLLSVASLITKLVMKVRGTYDETPRAVQIEEMCVFPFMFFGLAGVFALSMDVALGSQTFWQWFTVLFFVHAIASFRLPKIRWMRQIATRKQFLLINTVGIALGMPIYLALGYYSFVAFPI